jgi:hypothetical protein
MRPVRRTVAEGIGKGNRCSVGWNPTVANAAYVYVRRNVPRYLTGSFIVIE